jgi:hypothetical protein
MNEHTAPSSGLKSDQKTNTFIAVTTSNPIEFLVYSNYEQSQRRRMEVFTVWRCLYIPTKANYYMARNELFIQQNVFLCDLIIPFINQRLKRPHGAGSPTTGLCRIRQKEDMYRVAIYRKRDRNRR